MRTHTDIWAKVDYKHMRDICPTVHLDEMCTATSWAALTGDTIEEALYILYESTGKRPGLISWDHLRKVYQDMGYKLTRVYPTAKTTRTLERELTSGRYLVSVSGGGHALAIVDGSVVDWSKDRLHRIHKVWRFEHC